MSLKILAFIIGVPGILAALLTLLPRLTPTVSDPVDPDNVFSASVIITNTGSVKLKSVEAWIGFAVICGIHAPCPEADSPDASRDYPKRAQRAQWLPRDMEVDDRFTISLNDVFGETEPGGIQYADIAVSIDYELPIIHWKRKKTFPLFTRRATNGKLYWYWK